MRKLFFIFLFFTGMVIHVAAQEADSTNFSIYYDSPGKYIIADIDIVGIRYYDSNSLIQVSGLKVGSELNTPGQDFTDALKKLWAQGLFSDIKITATKKVGDKVWIEIYLQERPRLSEANFIGVTKAEKDDITEKVLLLVGSQVTDNQVNNAERIIKNIFLDKGFLDTEVNVIQRDDTSKVNSVILDIYVDKKEKVKIQDVIFHGNVEVKTGYLEKAMKKTKAKKIKNFFGSKKFLEAKFKEDKVNLVKKYNEKGYRDAIVLRDTVVKVPGENRVNVEIWVDEGHRYYFRDIKWVGNTVYPSDYLTGYLGIKRGDVFDQSLLDKRLNDNDEGLSNLYLDQGYLFFSLDPVETNIEGDSIDFEMRINEDKQAVINKVGIEGNTKTNEHVARRELRTAPGDLFSKSNIIRSIRELSQLGHFDPEAINPDVVPHREDGTVDINYQLEEKANDQVELSGGWGAGMFVGSIGLKFANFSVRNIFTKDAWRPLPTGDGQTLSLRYQTSGKYYRTVSLSFIEPWLGGKKPNSFSLSLSHSRINYSANNYYSNYNNYGNYYSGYSAYSSGYGYNPYGYSYNYDSADDGDSEDDQIWETTALALGYGYRLTWPDDYFTVYHEMSMEHYNLKNMGTYFYFLADENGEVNGTFNNASLKTVIGRNSVDNPLFSRSGSQISLTLKITPPYSLFDATDYSNSDVENSKRYKWIEYHKWVLKGQHYNAISRDKNLVLRTAYELGVLGYFDAYRRSPFEGFIVGGSGMSGYNIYGTDYVALRGYKDFSLSPSNGSSIYSKFTMEMRYPITLKPSATIYALSFIEAGNAETSFQNYNPFKLHRSAGIGVRIYLPMFGLMGIDWGYGFDKIAGQSGANGSQFHFVMGQQF